jgi:hypothetical protein
MSTRVVSEIATQIPSMKMDLPLEMQRCVEGSPVRFQLSTVISPGQESSGIQYVEFYVDGTRIGESYYPIYAYQKDCKTEIWRLDHKSDCYG